MLSMTRVFRGDPSDRRYYRDRQWRNHPMFRTDDRDRSWKRHREAQYKPVTLAGLIDDPLRHS